MLTREQKLMRRFLRVNSAEWTHDHPDAAYLYGGPFGFVLEHGEWFEPSHLPDMYSGGMHARCFGNSIAASLRYGLGYVEGYAMDPGSLGMIYHHAWNVDADGGLVDTTWCRQVALDLHGSGLRVRGMAGLVYLGVRFAVERADDATWNGDANILDDSNRDWPLLHHEWHGEPEVAPEYAGTGERLAILRGRDSEAWDKYVEANA